MCLKDTLICFEMECLQPLRKGRILILIFIPKNNSDKISRLNFCLKVSKSWKQFMFSSILPKNEQKQFDLRYHKGQ